MIYCLLGKTSSGKSTALKKLIDLGVTTVVTYTTRPKRPGEIEGKDYHFLTDKEFQRFGESLVGKRSILVANGDTWSYGVDINDLMIGTEDRVLIIEPHGFRDLINRFGRDQVKGIYLDVPYVVRFARGSKRGDDLSELVRRLRADDEDFAGFENEVDYVISSLTKEAVLDKLLQIIGGGRDE